MKNLQQKKFNAIMKPVAQTTTLCVDTNRHSIELSAILDKLETIKRTNKIIYTIAHLQLVYALRIGEVLSLKFEDVDKLGRCFVLGSKNSDSKIINVREYYLFEQKLNGCSGLIFSDFNRFYVYREYKKMGIYNQLTGRQNVSTTHILRHLSASEVAEKGKKMAVKQRLLGHKNPNNTKIYDNEQQKK